MTRRRYIDIYIRVNCFFYHVQVIFLTIVKINKIYQTFLSHIVIMHIDIIIIIISITLWNGYGVIVGIYIE